MTLLLESIKGVSIIFDHPESNPLVIGYKVQYLEQRVPELLLGMDYQERLLVGALLKESATRSQQLDHRCKSGIERAIELIQSVMGPGSLYHLGGLARFYPEGVFMKRKLAGV